MGSGVRIVYVSPLKALSYDIERNLRAPLKGIGAEISVGLRTGDTPQKERQAMRRTPPDILITTPESLYLIITSQAREILTGVEAVIVDEIHAVAQSKRGAHLALTLERLSHLVTERGKPRAAADRALGDSAPARADRELPGRAAARVRDRRRRGPQGARPRDRRPGRGHDGARRRHRASGRGRAARCSPRLHPTASTPARSRPPSTRPPTRARSGRRSTRSCSSWSASTPRRSSSSTTAAAPNASPSASTSSTTTDPSPNCRPPSRRATRGASRRPETQRDRTRPPPTLVLQEVASSKRSPAPTTARSLTRSAWWSRSCSSRASCPAWSRPRRSSSGSTWAPSTW